LLFSERMPKAELKDSKDSSRSRHGSVAFVLPVALLAAGGIWFWVNRGEGAAVAAEQQPRVQSTLHLEPFVLNLADDDQRSYLRVGIDLGMNREPKREPAAPVSQVRDTILGVLAEGKVNELLTTAGKAKLKDDLLRALQQRVPELGIEEVYFTEFLIQR
jgi:flagellar basal body-associated protein FliL